MSTIQLSKKMQEELAHFTEQKPAFALVARDADKPQADLKPRGTAHYDEKLNAIVIIIPVVEPHISQDGKGKSWVCASDSGQVAKVVAPNGNALRFSASAYYSREVKSKTPAPVANVKDLLDKDARRKELQAQLDALK